MKNGHFNIVKRVPCKSNRGRTDKPRIVRMSNDSVTSTSHVTGELMVLNLLLEGSEKSDRIHWNGGGSHVLVGGTCVGI